MSTRALHIHVTGPVVTDADHETITVGANIIMGRDDGDPISDSIYAEIDLKPGLLYRTSIEMNVEIAGKVKDFMYSTYSIPTNGYAVTYVSGAYGLLTIL